MERFRTSLETLTIPFRFILPTMMALLLYNYHNDQIELHSDLSDLKTGQEKIWTAVSNNKNKIDCVQNQLSKCCKDSVYCA